jgi:hypothetical protein
MLGGMGWVFRRLWWLFVVGLFLLGVWLLPSDIEQASEQPPKWLAVLAMLRSDLMYWAGVVAVMICAAYIVGNEFGPKIYGHFFPPKPPPPEPTDIVLAKQELSKFVTMFLIPASEAAQEMNRIAAYTARDIEPNSKLLLFVFLGVLGRGAMTHEVRALGNAEVVRRSNLSNLEEAVRQNLLNYYVCTNRVHDVTSLLTKPAPGVLAGSGTLLEQMRKWLPLHQVMKAQLLKLAQLNQFPKLKEFCREGHFVQKEYSDELFIQYSA